ncbi:hypothetical protein HPB48_024565 [Haemaphysalis longicornis]|uniref:Transposase Tc1-like domain-containing protein n=1 Tax=Haemaphysalis longicornis TaxID=44386 RepID=A0A9J6H6H8_HAELO|nr:hypothetical protein HPB48_024565 [Haemaphysalis longicornis]
MPPRIPQAKRLQIIGMSMSDLAQKKIAQATGVAEASVGRIILAYRGEGRIADSPRCLTKKTTEEEDLQIVSCMSDNPFITAGQIRALLGLNVSNELIRQRLREAGIRNRIAAQKPLLSDNARAKRLAFAPEHLHWTVDDRHNVAFTDESSFCSKWDQTQKVYRPVATLGFPPGALLSYIPYY